jgi:RNA polymerase sigma factor (TIGR02999 family)
MLQSTIGKSRVRDIKLLCSEMNSSNPPSEQACPGQKADALLEKVYWELRKLASSKMAKESDPQTLQPTALVHEVWLRLGASDGDWENTSHFFSAAAQAMRRILIERARKNSRLKWGGEFTRVTFEGLELREATVDERILLIHEALEHLSAFDSQKAQIVELKFFGGLTNTEVANLLNVTERTIERQWAFAKTWLYSEIGGQRSSGI